MYLIYRIKSRVIMGYLTLSPRKPPFATKVDWRLGVKGLTQISLNQAKKIKMYMNGKLLHVKKIFQKYMYMMPCIFILNCRWKIICKNVHDINYGQWEIWGFSTILRLLTVDPIYTAAWPLTTSTILVQRNNKLCWY